LSEARLAQPLLLVVAAALLDASGRVLVQQRPAGDSMAGLWEFPGGKVDSGETPEAALVREVHEELGIRLGTFAPLSFVEATVGGQHLLMLLYLCRAWHGEPAALHASALQWVTPDALYALPMPPADLPLIASIAAAAERFGQ
jgi:8-oxo-dGTP diphosphatase